MTTVTVSAMTAMIIGQRLAGWPTDRAGLIDMLARAGFLAAEICEHFDEAAAIAGVAAGADPMVALIDAYEEGNRRYEELATGRKTNAEYDAIAAATYEEPWHEILSGTVTPTTLEGAARAVVVASDSDDMGTTEGLLKSAARFFRPFVTPRREPGGAIRQAIDEGMIETIARQREHAEEARI